MKEERERERENIHPKKKMKKNGFGKVKKGVLKVKRR
jgi:hypothetical protein